MSRLNIADIVNTADMVRRKRRVVQARCLHQSCEGVAIQLRWLREWEARMWRQHLKVTRTEAIALGEMLQAYCLAEEDDGGGDYVHDASCAFEEAASNLYLSQAA